MNVGHTHTNHSFHSGVFWKYHSGWVPLWAALVVTTVVVGGLAHLETACAPIARALHSPSAVDIWMLLFFLYSFDMFLLDKSLQPLRAERRMTFMWLFLWNCFLIFNMWWIEMLSELFLKNNTGNMKEGFIMFIIIWIRLCVKMIINANLIYTEWWLIWFFFWQWFVKSKLTFVSYE